MRGEHKKTWLSLSPLESVIALVLVMVLVGVSFGLGMYYGQDLVEEHVRVIPLRDKEAMSTIETYLREHPSSFHFQKEVSSNSSDEKKFVYTLDEPTSLRAQSSALVRKSPEPAPVALVPNPKEAVAPSGLSVSPEKPVDLPVLSSPLSPAGNYVIQVESFDDAGRAQKKVDFLKEKGYAAFVESNAGATLSYRLYVGPYLTKEAAKTALSSLRGLTRPDIFIRRHETPGQ